MRVPTGRSVLSFVVPVVFFWVVLALVGATFNVSLAASWPADDEPDSEIALSEANISPTIWVLDEIEYKKIENVAGDRPETTGAFTPGTRTIRNNSEWLVDYWAYVYIHHEASFSYPPYLISGQPETFRLSAKADIVNPELVSPYEYWIHYAANTTTPYYYNGAVSCPYGVDMRRHYPGDGDVPSPWNAYSWCSYDADVELWPELAAAGGDEFKHAFPGALAGSDRFTIRRMPTTNSTFPSLTAAAPT